MSDKTTFAWLQAVQDLHDCGLVHNDLKPENARVTMQVDGSHAHVMLVDLGACAEIGTSEGSCCPTPLTLIRMLFCW